MLNLHSIYFGQKHPSFDYKDFDIIKKVGRLARKHARQCVNDCNGYGYIVNQVYHTGNIDDYARREYGSSVKSGYVDGTEETVFYKEIGKIEDKINKIVYQFVMDKYALWRVKPLKVEYQHDPRGNTVKLYYEGDFIELS